MHEWTEHGDADTELARWLRSRIGHTKLREIQRRAARRGISLNASLLSTYLHGIFPTPELVRRLAAYFEVDPAEIEALRPQEPIGEAPISPLPAAPEGAIEGPAATDREKMAALARLYSAASRATELSTEEVESIVGLIERVTAAKRARERGGERRQRSQAGGGDQERNGD